MPLLKKKTASKKPAKEVSCPFAEGDAVQFDNDGDTVVGEVTAINEDDETLEITTEDGDAYDIGWKDVEPVAPEEEEEEEKPAKKGAKKPAAKEKAAPAKSSAKKGKGSSLASAFNNAKAAAVGGGLPEGKWEALVVGAEIKENAGGTFAEFEVCAVNTDDETVEGRSGRLSYMLLDPDGDVAAGMDFFKRDIAILGCEEEEFEDDDAVLAAMEAVAEQELWISITVKVNKSGYTNTFLNGPMEDQDDKPERPAY